MKILFQLIISFVTASFLVGSSLPALAVTSGALSPSRIAKCKTQETKIQRHIGHVNADLIKVLRQGEAASTRIRRNSRRIAPSASILAAVQTQHNKLMSDILAMRHNSKFRCDSQDPKLGLDHYKAASKTAHADVRAYVEAVHKLKLATK